ncbi:carbohydrate ABC transporter permease [Thalassospira lucentensis]|uniref:carbohydrate ABC transporter permease n=1 Tax=Thalassospira lucentensis TaxID=168935 RepID=UPI00142DBFE4|nr:carbohydrate ABC transporter permease [Thalassospira lucentensis]NIZ01656.1 carbohydrate ABC transporter permease [Thalassospira lucentensis]
MRIGTGLLLGLISGLIWGVIAIVITGISLTLITGLAATPIISAGALGGAVNAAIIISRPPKKRTPGLYLVAFAAVVIAMMLVSFGMPFSLSFSQSSAIQAFGVGLIAMAITFANRMCLIDAHAGMLKRYSFDLVIVRVLKGLGFVFFSVIVILPFYVMVMTSLKNQQDLFLNPLDLSIDLTQGVGSLVDSYVELFTQFNFGSFLLTSTIVSVSTVLVTLAFSIPGAYAVARLKFPGQAVLSSSILLIYLVPMIVLVIPLYAVFSQLGLRNSLIGLLIVYPATTVPVALYMLQGYFRGIPAELEEAGLMDGLSRLGVIWKITLPLALPALASVSLYVFMIAWNEFLFAFMFLDDPGIFTLSRGVVSLNSSEVPRQHLMAGAVIATVPILAIFLWFERFLVQGLTAGSVKG